MMVALNLSQNGTSMSKVSEGLEHELYVQPKPYKARDKPTKADDLANNKDWSNYKKEEKD